jgi:hypothetical protein
VAHIKRRAVERAFLAADLVCDRVRLIKPTIGQAAVLLKVNRRYVAAAAAIGDDNIKRGVIVRGRRPLITPPVKSEPETLAAHLARSTPTERLEAARKIGVGVIWDEMLSPLLT